MNSPGLQSSFGEKMVDRQPEIFSLKLPVASQKLSSSRSGTAAVLNVEKLLVPF
jgi:hypothetical protein